MPIDELRPRAATFAAVFIVLLMLSGALPVNPAAAAPEDLPQLPCDDFAYVAGQGPSCRLDNGLWAIKRQDGAIMYSHGPDPAPPAPGSGGPDVPAAPPAAPACAASSDLYAGLLIYTYPPNKTNRSATMVPSIRSMMNSANGVLREEAAEFGYVANYEMRCLSDGTTLRVDSVMLDTVSGSDAFSSITSELASRGYTDYKTKYWVWHDDGVGGYGGQGNIWGDDRSILENYNNGYSGAGAMYGITYGYSDFSIMMHENGHNLGAVQLTAPDSSGGWHCNDGVDIMCYSDGGSNASYSGTVCTDREHFDCDHDSYFRPGASGNNYIATHWNIGNVTTARYIQYAASTPPVMTNTTCNPNPTITFKTTACSFKATTSMTGVYFSVNWGDGSALQRVPSSGFVASGTAATATHIWSTTGSKTVMATPTDSSTPALTGTGLSLTEVVNPPCIYVGGTLLIGLNGVAIDGISSRDHSVASSCSGKTYRITTTTGNDFDPCWYNGATLIRCDTGLSVSQTGSIPAGTTLVRVTYMLGVNGAYTLVEV